MASVPSTSVPASSPPPPRPPCVLSRFRRLCCSTAGGGRRAARGRLSLAGRIRPQKATVTRPTPTPRPHQDQTHARRHTLERAATPGGSDLQARSVRSSFPPLSHLHPPPSARMYAPEVRNKRRRCAKGHHHARHTWIGAHANAPATTSEGMTTLTPPHMLDSLSSLLPLLF